MTSLLHTAIPEPPQNAWAEDIHNQQMTALRTAGDLDLLLVGDSLAQHWPLDT